MTRVLGDGTFYVRRLVCGRLDGSLLGCLRRDARCVTLRLGLGNENILSCFSFGDGGFGRRHISCAPSCIWGRGLERKFAGLLM